MNCLHLLNGYFIASTEYNKSKNELKYVLWRMKNFIAKICARLWTLIIPVNCEPMMRGDNRNLQTVINFMETFENSNMNFCQNLYVFSGIECEYEPMLGPMVTCWSNILIYVYSVDVSVRYVLVIWSVVMLSTCGAF